MNHWVSSVMKLIYSISSSCRVANTGFPDTLSPFTPINNRLLQVCVHPKLMYILVGRPTFVRLCEWVHWRTSLMSSSLLRQQCPACFVRLIWMVLEMVGRWPNSCCFVGYCFQDLFNLARSILVQFPFCYFSIRLVSIHVVHPDSRIDTTAALKNYVTNMCVCVCAQEYLIPYNCELFILRVIAWSYTCVLRIIIIRYLKPYNWK